MWSKKLVEKYYDSAISTINKIGDVNKRLDNIESKINHIEEMLDSMTALLKHNLYAENTDTADKLRNKNPELYDWILQIISILN